MARMLLALPLALLLCACSNRESSLSSPPDLGALRANLAFTCVHEEDHLPQLDPEANELFLYARHLQKLRGPKDFNEIARYYRIAAAHGHYKANHNVQRLISQGFANSPSPSREAIDLAERLIRQGIPGGYFDMGRYLESGYGVRQDDDLALRYFRKAADLGSPEAQAYVVEKLAPADKAPDVARAMRQCAADQGNGRAAVLLGINLKNSLLYQDAARAFQQGVKAGNSQAALSLDHAFNGPPKDDGLDYLDLPFDAERVRRYKAIWKFLISNDGRSPKVPDIDKIVPLPPAQLPDWDGTFQWKKDQDASALPTKPSDELVQRLAAEKNLDPTTGLPLVPTTKTERDRLPLGTIARTGERCPQGGLWCVPHVASMKPDATRYFEEGYVMPPLVYIDPRLIPGLDWLLGTREYVSEVGWQLISSEAQGWLRAD